MTMSHDVLYFLLIIVSLSVICQQFNCEMRVEILLYLHFSFSEEDVQCWTVLSVSRVDYLFLLNYDRMKNKFFLLYKLRSDYYFFCFVIYIFDKRIFILWNFMCRVQFKICWNDFSERAVDCVNWLRIRLNSFTNNYL